MIHHVARIPVHKRLFEMVLKLLVAREIQWLKDAGAVWWNEGNADIIVSKNCLKRLRLVCPEYVHDAEGFLVRGELQPFTHRLAVWNEQLVGELNHGGSV
jgi:hypothetical protein